MRDGIQLGLDALDAEAATKLHEIEGVAIVVMDFGAVEVFS
jgi:hypothetical protein